jgi:hypothetical protein
MFVANVICFDYIRIVIHESEIGITNSISSLFKIKLFWFLESRLVEYLIVALFVLKF